MPERALPPPSLPAEGPPPARSWGDRDPAAAARLAAARARLGALAEELTLPVENLLAPDTVRRLSWAPPPEVSVETVAEFLRGHGARAWQVSLTARLLAEALDSAPTPDDHRR
jgi:ribonuclease D